MAHHSGGSGHPDGLLDMVGDNNAQCAAPRPFGHIAFVGDGSGHDRLVGATQLSARRFETACVETELRIC
jgi:hypothetical protein